MQAIIEGNLYEVEPAVKVIIDKLMIENNELKKENAQLEEKFQKATGVIATDSLPTRAELYKIKLMCKGKACRECDYGDKVEVGYACVMNGMPCRWEFGGA